MIINIRGTNGCLSGDTLIDCPRGLLQHPRGIPIRELVGSAPFWTYSWDVATDTMVLAKVLKVWCSGRKLVYRVPVTAYATRNLVKLRDGTTSVGRYLPPCELVGTYDHEVMLSDGSWRKLGELRPGDSLKSFYRRHADRGKLYWSTDVRLEQTVVGRSRVSKPFVYYGRTKPVSEQQFVCTAVHGPRPSGADVHHKDENSYNHQPDNLEWKDSSRHKSDHLREYNLRGERGWQKTGEHPRGMAGKVHSNKTKQAISKGSSAMHKRRREIVLNHRVTATPAVVGVMPVFDMEVERTANFVANGIVVHNSGKTTIVKKFLKFPHDELHGVLGIKRPEAYKVKLGPRPLFVIGSYQSATGGMDALPLSATEQVGLLIKYQKQGHVLFEGVVISTYYGAIGDWLAAHRNEALVVFLNTSLNTCLSSIETRSGDAARTKNVESKIKSIESARQRMIEAGIPTLTVNRDEAFQKIKAYIA